ncbi:MAG: hypothetical protein U0P45_13010 [Acidimicrobiales bacterium]
MAATSAEPSAAPAAADEAVRWYAGYFGLQAVAGIAFWALVAWVGPINELFQMSKARHAVTNSFLFADLVIGIAGSAVAAVGLWRARRWAGALALFVAGGMVYATVYLVGWVAFTGDGAALLALMIPPSSLSAWCAVQGWRLTR